MKTKVFITKPKTKNMHIYHTLKHNYKYKIYYVLNQQKST